MGGWASQSVRTWRTLGKQLVDAIADTCAADPWLREHPVRVEWWGGQFAPGLTDADVSPRCRPASARVCVRPNPGDVGHPVRQ